jgi:hypothetical protein
MARGATIMHKDRIYVGIHHDNFGMSPTANIIRDAWVFGFLPETETCEGWTFDRIEILYDKVTAAWMPYGHLASRLPPELRERHAQLYGEAIRHAREQGWDPGIDEDE